MPNEDRVRTLVEMGFDELKARNALILAFNNLDDATELLILNRPGLDAPIQ